MVSENVSTVLYIVAGVILAVGINWGMGLALGTSMPIVAVESNSMVPSFYKGDILILQGAAREDLAIGDVIVFIPEGRGVPIVHRIVETNLDGSFQTKGDANPQQLPFEKNIPYQTIQGRSIVTVPYLGWVKIGLTEFILPNIIWVAAGVIVAYLLYGQRRRLF